MPPTLVVHNEGPSHGRSELQVESAGCLHSLQGKNNKSDIGIDVFAESDQGLKLIPAKLIHKQAAEGSTVAASFC